MFVALARVPAYERPAIKEAIVRTLAPQGGLAGILGARRQVLLKPNFVKPETAARPSTTHPEFYLAVAELLLDLGCQVTIADSPAFGSAELAVRLHGALDECRRLGVRVRTFRQAEDLEGLKDPADEPYAQLSIAAELREYEALINLPKLKVHQQFVFTGATKNLYGCVTGKRKAWRHFISRNDVQLFARMVLANARAAAPILNLGDGVVAMHRHGPTGGDPYPLGVVLASDDFLAHDWAMAAVIDHDPAACPLFQVLADAERQRLIDGTRELLAAPDFPRATDLEPAVLSDIRFSPQHLVRSVWKSVKAGL